MCNLLFSHALQNNKTHVSDLPPSPLDADFGNVSFWGLAIFMEHQPFQERGFAVESGSTPDTEFLSMPVAILVGMTKASSKLWTCQPNLPLTQLYVFHPCQEGGR